LRLFLVEWSISNDFEAFEGFDYKCEAFIKITRLFEDIFREMEDQIKNLRLFKELEDF
jgi:hypothetical protein